jgi:hypothetical protein
MSYSPAALGATQAHPDLFPPEFSSIGINPRDAARNDLLGMTVTRRAADEAAFGLSYLDSKDGGDNEDFFLLDLPSETITYWPGASFEKAYPEYAGAHRGAKPYLRQ